MGEQTGTTVRRAVPRWVWLAIAGLTVVVLLTCGFGLYAVIAWGPPMFESESIGEMGGASTSGPEGTYSVTTPHWQRGNRLVLVGQTQFPGKPKGPSYVVLARLPNSWSWGMGGGSASGGELKLHTHTSLRDRNGQPFDVAYDLLNDGKTEQVWFGGKQYRPEEGRVFLVDLRLLPAAFKQSKTGFDDLLKRHGQGMAGLKPLVQALQERDEEVREFWR
jgi:hypothetical protein